jgi:hypothetical protein
MDGKQEIKRFKPMIKNKHEKLTFNYRPIKLTLMTINNILYFVYDIFFIQIHNRKQA